MFRMKVRNTGGIKKEVVAYEEGVIPEGFEDVIKLVRYLGESDEELQARLLQKELFGWEVIRDQIEYGKLVGYVLGRRRDAF